MWWDLPLHFIQGRNVTTGHKAPTGGSRVPEQNDYAKKAGRELVKRPLAGRKGIKLGSPHGPDQHGNSNNDSVDGKRSKASAPHPIHEPRNHCECHVK